MKFEKVVESHYYDRFGELLYILHKNNRKYLNDALAEYDLNLLQAMCMFIMIDRKDINQQELADLLFLTKSGTTKAIRKLEVDGFIERSKSEKDARQYVLNLTQKGYDTIPTLIRIYEEWEELIGLNELDKEFFEILTKLTYKAIDLNKKE
ncbi:MAG: MarR family transcriptional regulator [Methanobrevibacter sp.]|nr:MarR family transcriptional regulator [Methanobrevibacter sp.]